MNIAGLNKAAVLAALYNGSHQQGMGTLDSSGRLGMTNARAQELLDASHDKYFDYMNGRVMKVSLASDELRTALYNRDNGAGAAEAIIENMIADGQVEEWLNIKSEPSA